MPEMTQNPDYQLVMKFLQNISPGDMDQESSEQLMMIGQRIQAGGALSDREREMFESVVGATERFPTEQMDSFPQGGTNPDLMRDSMPSGMNVDPNVMNMDDAVAAGIVNPTRPVMRPVPPPTAPMKSLRPVMRPTR